MAQINLTTEKTLLTIIQTINYIVNTQNTNIGGDFNMVQELKHRSGGIICNTDLVGSTNLNKLTETQRLHER